MCVQVPPFPGLESIGIDGCNGYSAKIVDGMSDGRAHAFDEPFTSFVYREPDESCLVLSLENFRFCWCCDTVFKHDPLLQFVKGFLVYDTLDPGMINLVNLVAGVGEPIGEFTIVGEEEGPGDVHVESTDGEDTCGYTSNKIYDGFATVCIFCGRDNALRFVEEDVDFRIPDYRSTIEEDCIDFGVDRLTNLSGFTIDGDAPILD